LSASPAPNNICFTRAEIEKYKSDCEATEGELFSTNLALQSALLKPNNLSFYQEKSFVAGLSILVLVLGVNVVGQK
jgi:hypothetical protein